MKEVKLTVYLEDDEDDEDLIEALGVFCLSHGVTNKIITTYWWPKSKYENRET